MSKSQEYNYNCLSPLQVWVLELEGRVENLCGSFDGLKCSFWDLLIWVCFGVVCVCGGGVTVPSALMTMATTVVFTPTSTQTLVFPCSCRWGLQSGYRLPPPPHHHHHRHNVQLFSHHLFIHLDQQASQDLSSSSFILHHHWRWFPVSPQPF